MVALEGEELLTAGSAVPLLERSRVHADEDDGRLFDTCRRFLLENRSAVVAAGGLKQLQEHAPVTKGLLRDAYEELDLYKGRGGGGDEGNPRGRKRRRTQ